MPDTAQAGPGVEHSAAFVSTHWSTVLSAGRPGTPEAEAALERLCQTYWYPIYSYVRRRGYAVEEAKDNSSIPFDSTDLPQVPCKCCTKTSQTY